MDKQVLNDLHTIAKYLVEQYPDATFADLLIAYFGHITGIDYSSTLGAPPDDLDIVKMHVDDLTPQQIAFWLDDDADYVRWILLRYGFSPNAANTADAKSQVEHLKYKELIENGTFA